MSGEKQESLADIVADKRQGMNPNGTAECQYLESDICTLADRIEAAAKREREAAEADALTVGGVVEAERHKPGNAAAMREALVLARERIVETRGYYDADADKEDYEALLATIDAALAAPPRNCDRFATWEEALSAFCEETGNRKPLELWLGCEIQAFAIWHYAPAKQETKGEPDGSKL